MLKIQSRRASKTLNLNDAFLFFVLFCALRLDSINYIFPLRRLFYYYAPLAILLISLALFIITKAQRSSVIYFTIALFGLYFFSTVLRSPGNAYSALSNFAAPLAIALLAEMNMRRRPLHFLRVLQALFVTLMLVDLLTIFLFPQGLYASALYTQNWLLGYKSARVRAVTLPAIAVAGLLDVYDYGKPRLRFILISVLAILDTYLSSATAGTLVCLFEFTAIMVMFFLRTNWIRRLAKRLFNVKALLLIVVGLNLFFVFFQAFQNNAWIEYVIVELLEKNMTLAGRLKIWTVSIDQFRNAWLIGNGYISGNQYILLTGVRGGTQPHNLVLAILVYTGLAGLLLYSILLVLTLRRADVKGRSFSTICAVSVFANLLFGITSMNFFGQFHYAMMVMLYYLSIHEKSEAFGAKLS